MNIKKNNLAIANIKKQIFILGQKIKYMIYVSISTIPQRLKNIGESVESLLKQTLKPDKIFNSSVFFGKSSF